MEAFINYLKLNIDTENSRHSYISYMKHFFKLNNVFNQETVNGYLAQAIDNNLKASTFNVRLVTLTHYAKCKKIDIEFPRLKKQNSKISEYLTHKEIYEDILPYFDYIFKKSGKRKLIFKFMFHTGLRLNEIINLKKEDFCFKSKEIKVRNTKGKVDRKVYIHSSIYEDLKKELEKNKDSAFCIEKIYIQYMMMKINTELSYYKKITPHVLRHSCATYLSRQGWTLVKIQKLFGHKSIETTKRYVHTEEDDIKNDFLKLKY